CSGEKPNADDLSVESVARAFIIDVSWEKKEEHISYKLYLNGNYVTETHDNSYQFTKLIPNEGYELFVVEIDEDGSIVSCYEEFGITTTDDYEPIEISAIYDDAVYVHLENDEAMDYDSYELSVNGELTDSY